MFIRLKPRSQRALSADEIIQELRPKVSQVPGIMMFMQNLPPIRIGGQLTKSQYQFTLRVRTRMNSIEQFAHGAGKQEQAFPNSRM